MHVSVLLIYYVENKNVETSKFIEDSIMNKRNVGVDLLRIFSMFLICIIHILDNSNILYGDNNSITINYGIAWVLEIIAICAVNSYALISGYVGVDTKYKYTGIIQLWFQVIFYTLLITCVFSLWKPEVIGVKEVFAALTPVISEEYWYFTAYFAMFFFIPFLNFLVNEMKQKHVYQLVISLVGVFCIMQTLAHKDIFGTFGGNSTLWLSILYIIGAYIKKYNVNKKITNKKAVLIYFICIILTWGSKLFIEVITLKVFGTAKGGSLLFMHTSPTILVAAVMMLIIFSNLEFKENIAKYIVFFGKCTFSIYLIHTHPLVWNNILNVLFSSYATLSTIIFPFAIIGSAMGIYVICTLIDIIRVYFFKIIRINILSEKIETLFKSILKKLVQNSAL